MTQCDRYALSLHLDRELPLPTRRALNEHLLTCAACRQELEELRRLDQVLHEWGSSRRPVPQQAEARILASVERRRLRPLLGLSRMMPAAVGSGIAALLVVMSANLGWLYQNSGGATRSGGAAQVQRIIEKQSTPLQNARRTSAMLGVRTTPDSESTPRRFMALHID